MDLVFKNTECATRRIRIGVRGNNLVDKLKFIVARYPEEDIDLLQFTPYVKLENKECGYMDKDGKVEVDFDEKTGTINLIYRLRQKTTIYPTVNIQLQFEFFNDVGTSVVIWQTEVISLEFRRTVRADEEISDRYPSIIQDLANKVALLDGKSNIVRESKADFPEKGSENVIYVSIKENRLYRYDTETKEYIAFEPEWGKIKYIDGGKPNGKSN